TVRALKELANELNIVIIVASQLNREAVKDGSPSLIHLKDSGAIEEGADVVMLLTRKENNTLEVLVEKNRSGKIGKTSIAWLFEYSRMSDPEYYDIPEKIIEYAQYKYKKTAEKTVEKTVEKTLNGGDEWLYDF
ncbi:MAG: DnaB-like helicase C-terminal domain-containing protein, partial [Thermoanaerobaculia bacterium]